ncbi:cytochrome bc complex cytochrome b subunit [candidate division KSB1 bacterium]|nr:cytochrome bc complex cytochrome b subunit [candidate division KSB1 bacterium]MBL7094677.1 cytochrome bc complex cytochrome b subunit [candidate division KSB1 bacterium]
MKIKDWILERFPIDYNRIVEVTEKAFIKEPIPLHYKKWFFATGGAPLILIMFQIITGIFLMFYYVPSTEMAYESVRHITEEVRFGFWIRGIHKWGSNLLVISLLLHMTRVFFTRAYRRPRELNWIIGLMLLGLSLGLSLTGYSLIQNQVSYWATTIGTNSMGAIPLIGDSLLTFLRGGEEVTGNTLTRFFTFHVTLLPPLLILLIVVHIFILRLHGMAELEGRESEGTYAFYPEHFFKVVIMTFFILAVLSTLSVILPPGIGEPADPSVTPSIIKPEWYFFLVYIALKIMPMNIGMSVLMMLGVVMVFWPFIDEFFVKKMPKVRLHYFVGTIAILTFLVITLWEILV